MSTKLSDSFSGIAQRPLPVALALALVAIGASTVSHAVPATHTVTSCSDSGTGTLRSVVGAPTTISGDTVNFSAQLGCSTITLTSGAIAVNQSDLTLSGPGASALTIDAGVQSRVIQHTGTGTLHINDLTISDGINAQSQGSAIGGCIFSSGSVDLTNATVSHCTAAGIGVATNAYGGGISVSHDLTLTGSTLLFSRAEGSGNRIWGGGAFVAGNLQATNSSISNNFATTTGIYGDGGGLFTYGSANIVGTTISGNRADVDAGWFAFSISNTDAITISNSTISGNLASVSFGGIRSSVALTLANSTVAFNQGGTFAKGAGLYANGAALTLQSSIIADNIVSSTGAPSDLGGPVGTSITGTDNLITSGQSVVFPLGTLDACPRLGPLADNGGPTLTHALPHDSPAINHGDSASFPVNDQRGAGFPREFGPGVDIGAYEWQGTPDDRLFVSGFESACDH
jgi:hypothetical protein